MVSLPGHLSPVRMSAEIVNAKCNCRRCQRVVAVTDRSDRSARCLAASRPIAGRRWTVRRRTGRRVRRCCTHRTSATREIGTWRKRSQQRRSARRRPAGYPFTGQLRTVRRPGRDGDSSWIGASKSISVEPFPAPGRNRTRRVVSSSRKIDRPLMLPHRQGDASMPTRGCRRPGRACQSRRRSRLAKAIGHTADRCRYPGRRASCDLPGPQPTGWWP
jgi:hypothetical protein